MERLLILFSLALISTALHAGGVYKWTDENGQVHFTDKPPVGKQSQTHNVKPASGEAAQDIPGLRPGELEKLNATEQKNLTERLEKDKARKLQARQQEAEDERKRRNCESARKRASYYTDKLRTGCNGGSCDYYKRQREDYEHKAFEACR